MLIISKSFVFEEEFVGAALGDVFVEVVVDHDDGRGAAGGDAFDKLDGVFAVGTGGEAVGIRLSDFAFLAEVIAKRVTARHGAGEGAANLDQRFARRVLAEHGVEGDELEDVDGLQVELGGDPRDAFRRDVAEGFLPEVEEGEGGTALGDGIVGDQFVGLRFKALGQSGWGVMMIWSAGIDGSGEDRLGGGGDDRIAHDLVGEGIAVWSTTPLTKITWKSPPSG